MHKHILRTKQPTVMDMDMDMDMDMVLVTNDFDTMKEIGASSKSTSVFIPHGPGAVKDVASQIREGLLQALNA